MTTIESNPSKKSKEERIMKMLMEVMAIHEFLTKKFFEIHLKKMDLISWTHYILSWIVVNDSKLICYVTL